MAGRCPRLGVHLYVVHPPIPFSEYQEAALIPFIPSTAQSKGLAFRQEVTLEMTDLR